MHLLFEEWTYAWSPNIEARLILGRYSDDALNSCQLNAQQQRLSRSLDFLYNREYQARGDLSANDEASGNSGASLDDSQMLAIDWLHQAKSLEKCAKHLQPTTKIPT